MILARGFLAFTLVGGAMLSPALAQGQTPAEQCHALAASPYDPQTPWGEGVGLFNIESIPAIAACTNAAKANPNDARLRFALGRAFDAAGDYEKAHRHYEIAIAGGSTTAAVSLGELYEFGLGVDIDEARAAELYKVGADDNIILGIESLGKLYEDGRGVDQDYDRAAELYALAADEGSYWGMAALAWLTENGNGVPQDYAEAARLYRIAADGGIDFAQNNLATFYAEGVGGLEESQTEALRYYRLAADQGFVRAYLNLAVHYQDGLGVKRSLVRAEDYLRRAIEEGTDALSGEAANNLAWLFAVENIKLDEAEELARSAVAASPEDPIRLDTLAWVLHVDGRSAEALPIIEQAAELDPSNAEIEEHLDAIRTAAAD